VEQRGKYPKLKSRRENKLIRRVLFMGRSQLQGTPWHYEYAKGDGTYNSKKCVFNIGHCSCKASSNHNHECVGKFECEDFEKQMSSTKYKETKSIKTKPLQNVKNPKQKRKNKIPAVSVGDNIIVAHTKTNEEISIPIRDSKNPFVGKQLHEVATIRGEKYSVRKITKPSMKTRK